MQSQWKSNKVAAVTNWQQPRYGQPRSHTHHGFPDKLRSDDSTEAVLGALHWLVFNTVSWSPRSSPSVARHTLLLFDPRPSDIQSSMHFLPLLRCSAEFPFQCTLIESLTCCVGPFVGFGVGKGIAIAASTSIGNGVGIGVGIGIGIGVCRLKDLHAPSATRLCRIFCNFNVQ